MKLYHFTAMIHGLTILKEGMLRPTSRDLDNHSYAKSSKTLWNTAEHVPEMRQIGKDLLIKWGIENTKPSGLEVLWFTTNKTNAASFTEPNAQPDLDKSRLRFEIKAEPSKDIQPFTTIGRKHLAKPLYDYYTKNHIHTDWWVCLKEISLANITGLTLDNKPYDLVLISSDLAKIKQD